MKKFSFIVVILLLVSMISVPVFAAQTAQFTVSTSEIDVMKGDTFTVTVSTSAVDNCFSGGFLFSFDTDVFEYVAGSGSALVSGYTAAGVSTANGNLSGYFMNGDATIQGSVFQITLKVKSDVAPGTYTISGTPKIIAKANDVQEEIACSVSAATVTVSCDHVDSDNNGACDICGESLELIDSSLKFYRAKTTDPYGNFKLTGEIIAYLTARKQATYDDYYVVFTYTYLDNVVSFPVDPSSSSDAYYALFDCPVPAALMTTDVQATVYGVNGDKEYRGETITFTVRECVDAKLNMWIANYGKNAQVTKLFDTLVNMLEYGAQAQTRFGINTDNLATDGLPENYAAKIKTETLTLNTHSNPSESGMKATLYSMSLMLKEKINMYGNFKVKSGFTKIEDYKVVIVHTKADGSTVTHEITNVELKTGNYVYFEFDKVAPAQMRDELQITLYQNGEAVSATYIRSGETIVASLAAALQPLGNAAMQLADCAKAAFGG